MLAISGAVQPSPFLNLIVTCQKDNISKWIKPHEKRKRLHEFLFPNLYFSDSMFMKNN